MLGKAIVIFSGYNQRAVVSFCRVAQEQNVPLIIIARSESDPILDTKYGEYVKYIRKSKELDLSYIKHIFLEIKTKEVFDEYIILPSSEALNRFLLKNRNELATLNFITPLVDKHIYDLISDKYDFGNLCTKNNIKIPRELSFTELSNFPVVIKPKSYFTDAGKVIPPQIIKDELGLTGFISNNSTDDFYVQEYLGGESYYLLYYFCKDGSYKTFSQRNLLQQGQGKSIIAAVPSDIHNKEISNKFVDLFKSINFTGLVMVEVKYFNGEFFMIEANPRLWGPSQLFVDSKCRFFELFLSDWGFSVCMDEFSCLNSDTKYFWLGGLIESLYKYNEIVFHIDNYDSFINNFKHFLNNDVYLKEDTENIFTKEILDLIGVTKYGNS